MQLQIYARFFPKPQESDSIEREGKRADEIGWRGERPGGGEEECGGPGRKQGLPLAWMGG
ncbi:hypothetical protein PUN28_004556 [Cardiocondyla obscurior]|uniref:Uncharacterized protein n=1 Tax=Cardiocondyla obscurior TaxID=286306 RepID=A0AAW2GG22_9HYME